MRTLVNKETDIYVEAARAYANDRRGHRAAFLVQRDEVARLLRGGYSIRAVYALFRETGRVGCGYNTFRLYVHDHIPEHERQRAGSPQPAGAASPAVIGRPRGLGDAPREAARPRVKGKPYVERDPLELINSDEYP